MSGDERGKPTNLALVYCSFALPGTIDRASLDRPWSKAGSARGTYHRVAVACSVRACSLGLEERKSVIWAGSREESRATGHMQYSTACTHGLLHPDRARIIDLTTVTSPIAPSRCRQVVRFFVTFVTLCEPSLLVLS
jgi:hypothetical protein